MVWKELKDVSRKSLSLLKGRGVQKLSDARLWKEKGHAFGNERGPFEHYQRKRVLDMKGIPFETLSLSLSHGMIMPFLKLKFYFNITPIPWDSSFFLLLFFFISLSFSPLFLPSHACNYAEHIFLLCSVHKERQNLIWYSYDLPFFQFSIFALDPPPLNLFWP